MAGDSVLATLADEAQSEAKRFGADTCHSGHLLLVLIKRFPEQSKALDVDAAAVERYLAAKVPEESSASALLEAARQAPGDSVEFLIAELRDLAARVNNVDQRKHVAQPSQDSATLEKSSQLVSSPTLCASQEKVVDECLHLLQVGRTPITLHGPCGAGRTTVMVAVAERLKSAGIGGTVHSLPARKVLANPDSLIQLARSASADDIVLIDDVDLVLGLEQSGLIGSTTLGVMALLAEGGPRMIISLPSPLRTRLELRLGRLADRCRWIDVEAPPADELSDVLTAIAHNLAGDALTFSTEVLRIVSLKPSPRDRRAHPGLAVDRLAAAVARATVRGGAEVTAHDVMLAPQADTNRSTDLLRERLSAAVIGQPHAVERLARRIALTNARLDLRPERPDGVFLFVGPSGVGKTALARELAVQLYGHDSHLIRLDMSEYAEEWAISRLVGPQPGYVGSTEPDSWLTTKVRKQPNSVVLLDEIEKAHPDVWNVFLQVFDAGRLTDSRGEVADFSSTVVIMTSNLGTGVTETRAIGFTNDPRSATEAERRVLEVVQESMRPELLNRIDSTIVFRPLGPDELQTIARHEVDRFLGTIAAQGYSVTVDESVVSFLAADGYDPKFGARHLQRCIERHLLEELVGRGPGSWAVTIVDGSLSWSEP